MLLLKHPGMAVAASQDTRRRCISCYYIQNRLYEGILRAYLVYNIVCQRVGLRSIVIDHIAQNEHSQRGLQPISNATTQSPQQHQHHVNAIRISEDAIFGHHFRSSFQRRWPTFRGTMNFQLYALIKTKPYILHACDISNFPLKIGRLLHMSYCLFRCGQCKIANANKK